ncbi:MAG: PIN domain-containing protein [Blastocatellia bacterium]
MNGYVTDTHSLFWYLTNSPKLGPNASKAFDEADNGAALIYVPAIVLAELYYLNEKYGKPVDFAAEYGRIRSGSQFVLLPLMPEEVLDFDTDHAIAEMHDRMIVGAVRRLGVPCLTKDADIAASGLVATVW